MSISPQAFEDGFSHSHNEISRDPGTGDPEWDLSAILPDEPPLLRRCNAMTPEESTRFSRLCFGKKKKRKKVRVGLCECRLCCVWFRKKEIPFLYEVIEAAIGGRITMVECDHLRYQIGVRMSSSLRKEKKQRILDHMCRWIST